MHKDKLSNKVMREIISSIALGAYEKGQRLPGERRLCEQFGVSRGTLRDAIADLDTLGVVTIKPQSGVYVNSISDAVLPDRLLPRNIDSVNLDDIVYARKTIELAALDLVCGCISPKQIKHLEDLLAKMSDSLDDLFEFLKYDLEFHQSLVRFSGNTVLVTAFEAIYEYHKFSSVFTSQEEGEEQLALDTHGKLLAKLVKKDVAACRKILSEHLDHLKKYSMQGIKVTKPKKKH
jgi:GntR family transcriptional repressor for pyruvate dehydrogenase complex